MIESRCPENPFIHLSVSVSHTPRIRSWPPLARYFPSLLSAKASTSLECPEISASVERTFAFPFPLRLEECDSGGFIFGKETSLLPVAKSHFEIEPSFPEVYMNRASSEMTAAVTERRCPRIDNEATGAATDSFSIMSMSSLACLEATKHTESAKKRLIFPACCNWGEYYDMLNMTLHGTKLTTSCFRREAINSRSISAASTSPSPRLKYF